MLNGTMVWIDVETFGLNPERDPLLEIGFCIATPSGLKIESKNFLVWSPVHNARWEKTSGWVRKTHGESGLITDCKEFGITPDKAERKIINWLDMAGISQENKDRNHLCGSSVHFDRAVIEAQMPYILDAFHYRMVDVSTLKLLCAELNPEVFSHVPHKKMNHRVLKDIDDSIGEYQFYRENFLHES